MSKWPLILLMAMLCLMPSWMAVSHWLRGTAILLKVPVILACFLVIQVALLVVLLVFIQRTWRD